MCICIYTYMLYVVGNVASLVFPTSHEPSWPDDTCGQQSQPRLHRKQLNHILLTNPTCPFSPKSCLILIHWDTQERERERERGRDILSQTMYASARPNNNISYKITPTHHTQKHCRGNSKPYRFRFYIIIPLIMYIQVGLGEGVLHI